MVIRVALVNDDEVVVRGLDAMMRSYPHRVEIVELVAGRQVSRPVDVALYDTFGMGQGNGPAVARLIASPQVRQVAVYTWNFQPWLTRDTLNQGVRGYLSKSLPAARLVDALGAIASGQVVVSPARNRSSIVGGDWPGREEGLTAREAEVLSLITMGLSNQDIAERTLLSINSIKSYIRSAYRKIDVDSRSKAVLWGVEHGMRADRVRIHGSPAREG
ncbi:response regulator transcription factor [Nocardioides sp. S-58]|uniref:Response regulator transcription factor n=1 Tax=Nocardioides renjunii TaxID=3095075 RepID=A0ABU5K8M1_9ACTN|nr:MULTISPECIES: response regulator transcription factor [unclassified Nocardioides]MDZ5661256.1 response regulator transcription factor [Nocardioides sp. S-58]WQQ22258.1 response regulator transcription factor [Nocardioides sp. S-34]